MQDTTEVRQELGGDKNDFQRKRGTIKGTEEYPTLV